MADTIRPELTKCWWKLRRISKLVKVSDMEHADLTTVQSQGRLQQLFGLRL